MNVINCSYLDVCSDGSVHQLTQSYQLITILGLDVTVAFIGLLKTPFIWAALDYLFTIHTTGWLKSN